MFCHNPDSWDFSAGMEMAPDELLRKLDRFKNFLSTPGLTLSGGEPLAQPEFASTILLEAKKLGWHTAIDTSGRCAAETFIKVTAQADLLIMSIKHPVDPGKVLLTDAAPDDFNLHLLPHIKKNVWIRYVVIPGWTDDDQALRGLKTLLAGIPSLQKVELLPYNSLAENNWQGRAVNPIISSKPRVSEALLARVKARLSLPMALY
jgi:pyruvate formate lyase activating enzyme